MSYLNAGMIMNSAQELAVVIGCLVVMLSVLTHAVYIEEYSSSLIGTVMAALTLTALGSMSMIPRPRIVLLISELYFLVFVLPLLIVAGATIYKKSEVSFPNLCVTSFYGWFIATFVVAMIVRTSPMLQSDLLLAAVLNSVSVGVIGGTITFVWLDVRHKLSFNTEPNLNKWVTKAIQVWF